MRGWPIGILLVCYALLFLVWLAAMIANCRGALGFWWCAAFDTSTRQSQHRSQWGRTWKMR